MEYIGQAMDRNASARAERPQHMRIPSGSAVFPEHIRSTWAGPINPQLYGDSLNELCFNTNQNLHRLERVMRQPRSAQTAPFQIREPRDENLDEAWLQGSTVMFAPRETFTFQVRRLAADDDTWSSVSASSGPHNFCYLCSTLEEHQQHLMRMRVPKKSAANIKPRLKYIAPPPKMKRKVKKEPEEFCDNRYKIVVWTGNKANCTTDANVFVTIAGDMNILDKTRLSRGSGNSKMCFCRSSKETFFVKSPTLGNLAYLTIEHDGVEKRHSWFCEKVEVTCMKTLQHWVFHCDSWLSLHHGDYMTRRDLRANYVERKYQEFEITVYTGTKRLAGTDANVYVTFQGTERTSPKIRLVSDHSNKNLFQRGSVDKFHVRFIDVGEILTMRIEHDGKGLASGWFLDKVVVQNIEDPKVIYHFLLHGWLAKDVGNGHLWREIRAKKKLAKEITTGKPVSYQVTVRTGDVRYAGTDANVYIVIQGTKGKTKKLFMDDARNNFERGMTEVFELNASNVGHITRINIGHDNSGPGAGWFCEDVTVRKYLTKEEVVQFLNKLKKQKKPKDRHKKRLSDRVRERSLEDVKEESEDELEEAMEDDFPEGSYRDVFDRDGKVVKVPVYEEFYFVCKNWLAMDEADGLLEREIVVKNKSISFRDGKPRDDSVYDMYQFPRPKTCIGIECMLQPDDPFSQLTMPWVPGLWEPIRKLFKLIVQ
ncbi:lipoxygenase-like protein domain-containing protein 1 [Plakobranchus ocellatus]|uniref:Lipoxygenase-like protein domain-containing protein 1 n=1 Tax=Plakobranchus ocellatus TaxID=259542 RepID=A0AAV3ZGS5_9GAST|nr:lipoxygenase-like protein domain-containing protein 1 [Plakobranchus ocellatus]